MKIKVKDLNYSEKTLWNAAYVKYGITTFAKRCINEVGEVLDENEGCYLVQFGEDLSHLVQWIPVECCEVLKKEPEPEKGSRLQNIIYKGGYNMSEEIKKLTIKTNIKDLMQLLETLEEVLDKINNFELKVIGVETEK
jgi:hypothetical protein